jgi:hypothetical protein
VLASAPGRLPFRLRPGAGICATFGHMKRLYAQRRDLLRVGLGEDFGIEAMESSALRARATGEVCLTAVETGLTGRFRIKIVRNQKLTTPHAETPTHLIAMRSTKTWKTQCARQYGSAIRMITERAGPSAEQA